MHFKSAAVLKWGGSIPPLGGSNARLDANSPAVLPLLKLG